MFGLRGLCARWRFACCLDILTTCQVVAAFVVVLVGSFVDPQLLYAHLVQFVLRPHVFLAVGVWVGKDVLQVQSAIE